MDFNAFGRLWPCPSKWIWRFYTSGSQCLLGTEAVAVGSPSALFPYMWWEVWGNVHMYRALFQSLQTEMWVPEHIEYRSWRWRRPRSASAADQESSSSATPRSASHCPIRLVLLAQATLRQQEAQHLVLCAGPPSPQGCPNKTLWVNQKPKQQTNKNLLIIEWIFTARHYIVCSRLTLLIFSTT